MTMTFCAHAGLIDRYGFSIAIVFEKIWFLMHKSENASDFTTLDKETGLVWEHWTLPRLLEQFETTISTGQTVNVIREERTLRGIIDKLVSAKLLIRKRSQVGFKLAIDFHELFKVVGLDEHYEIFTTPKPVCLKNDKTKKEPVDGNPERPKNDKQLPDKVPNVENTTNRESENGQIERPKNDTPYVYDSLVGNQEDSQIQKTLPDTKASDGEISKPIATKVSRTSPEYKALEAVVKAQIYRGASLDFQAGAMIQYLVIQQATPEKLAKFIGWWRLTYPTAEIPRQIQRIAKTDNFQGKFVTRWEEWQLKFKPKPKTEGKPIIEPLPTPTDEERQAMLATLRERKPR